LKLERGACSGYELKTQYGKIDAKTYCTIEALFYLHSNVKEITSKHMKITIVLGKIKTHSLCTLHIIFVIVSLFYKKKINKNCNLHKNLLFQYDRVLNFFFFFFFILVRKLLSKCS
jgi:hypothetical protein